MVLVNIAIFLWRPAWRWLRENIRIVFVPQVAQRPVLATANNAPAPEPQHHNGGNGSTTATAVKLAAKMAENQDDFAKLHTGQDRIVGAIEGLGGKFDKLITLLSANTGNGESQADTTAKGE